MKGNEGDIKKRGVRSMESSEEKERNEWGGDCEGKLGLWINRREAERKGGMTLENRRTGGGSIM